MPRFLLSISLALVLCLSAWGQEVDYPSAHGDKVRYAAMIEMPRAYVSGICFLVNQDGAINGSMFNEFGISAMDFTYDPSRDKVKLHSVMPMLNKWYIKRVLKNDLKHLLKALQAGCGEYENKKRKITYKFTLISDETQE